ncbi:MAG: hypothetical protein PUC03_01610, partial [Clostridiales bacterium]|nr:hypothetical protein [Clostridiales bacterium]
FSILFFFLFIFFSSGGGPGPPPPGAYPFSNESLLPVFIGHNSRASVYRPNIKQESALKFPILPIMQTLCLK